MVDSKKVNRQQLDEKQLATEQALKYAEDLAIIYREEKARRKALEAANEKIRAVVDSISDGMLATNEQYIIVDVNQAICRLLETQKEDLLGQNLLKFLDIPELGERLIRTKEQGETTDRFELEMGLSGRRVVRVSVSMIHKEMGYVLVLHDITSEKRAENLKNEFLSILSHELRTPLNGILGFSEILSDELAGKVDQDISEYLEIIQKSGQRLLSTVEELINFAQLQDERLESLEEMIQIDAIVKDIFSELKDKSNEKEIHLDFKTSSENPIVTGNKSMLRDLFFTLFKMRSCLGNKGGTFLSN